MVEVFLVQTDNRIEGLKSIFSHFKTLFDSFRDKTIVIKPNFNTADPPPASTDIRVIKELIIHLKSLNPKKLILAERAGPANTHETMVAKGLFQLQQHLGGFDIVDLSLPETNWVEYHPTKSNWKNGFLFSKIVQEADVVIALPCLKTHRFGGHFTLALKLAVGLVPREGYSYMKELHSSPRQRSMIAEINEAYSPSLVILDGSEAFVQEGPEKGLQVNPHVLIASTDRIAIDAVGVAILRELGTTSEVMMGPIFKQEQIARAVELGLGIQDPSEIDIVTKDPKSALYAKKLKAMILE